MTPDTFIKGQLAMSCWRNAPEGKPESAMKAIAFVERNRVRAGWMGGDWLAVLQNGPAYSAYAANGHVYAAQQPRELLEAFPDLRNDHFQKFLWEVDRIYLGQAEDRMTEGALWYAVAEKITRPWFLEHIARKPEEHPRVAQVGTLTLWR